MAPLPPPVAVIGPKIDGVPEVNVGVTVPPGPTVIGYEVPNNKAVPAGAYKNPPAPPPPPVDGAPAPPPATTKYSLIVTFPKTFLQVPPSFTWASFKFLQVPLFFT